ncbi:MAG: DUF3575 domain-containing protein [Crocinitomicaceae bacterium]|nr:DUF3575 domain-containing protein [Crocinitomicaceae bacterium]
MKKGFLILSMLISIFAKAQDGPTVVVFNSSSEKKAPEYWKKYNLVKFSIFEAFAGDFAFYYERVLSENFTAEIGFGPTLSNYASMLWNDNFTINDDNYEPLMGGSFALGARYYPYHAADEFYFAPEFKYKFYHNNLTYMNMLGQTEEMEESWQVAMGRITFGYCYFFDDNIFIDGSAGFGIGKVKMVSLDYDDVTGVPYAKEDDILAPRFQVGLKVGVAF